MSDVVHNLHDFFSVYGEKWPAWSLSMGRALVVTLEITVWAFLLALAIGLGVAIARLNANRVIGRLALIYIEVTRGVPALVVLFIIYYGLVPIGVVLDAVPTAVLGLGLSAGGYVAEIFRAGLEAPHRGQREAALATGMTPVQVHRFILLPQAVRIVLAPLVSMLVSILKDSSLASLIAAPDIMLRAKNISSSDFLPLHIFIWAGAMYFVLALPLSVAAARFERRMRTGLGARL